MTNSKLHASASMRFYDKRLGGADRTSSSTASHAEAGHEGSAWRGVFCLGERSKCFLHYAMTLPRPGATVLLECWRVLPVGATAEYPSVYTAKF